MKVKENEEEEEDGEGNDKEEEEEEEEGVREVGLGCCMRPTKEEGTEER